MSPTLCARTKATSESEGGVPSGWPSNFVTTSPVLMPAFAAGELKHGPIALIEENTLVIAIATQSALYEKLGSNIKEVKARGARVLAICPEGANFIRELADEVIPLPMNEELFLPILAVIPTQLFAYHCSVERGFDVDKPRNLAKSVTVE